MGVGTGASGLETKGFVETFEYVVSMDIQKLLGEITMAHGVRHKQTFKMFNILLVSNNVYNALRQLRCCLC